MLTFKDKILGGNQNDYNNCYYYYYYYLKNKRNTFYGAGIC